MIRIRLLEKLPNAPVGSKLDVMDDHNENARINIASAVSGHGSIAYYLSELQGWFIEVKDMPKERDRFWFVDCAGLTNFALYVSSSIAHNQILNFQGHMKTEKEAEAFRNRIEEVRDEKL